MAEGILLPQFIPPEPDLSNYALTSHTHSGYAASTHTHSQYLTSHQSLYGYATQSWVQQNFEPKGSGSGSGSSGAGSVTIDMKITSTPDYSSTAGNPTVCGTYSLSRKANVCVITPIRVTDPSSNVEFISNSYNQMTIEPVTLSNVECAIIRVGLTYNHNDCGTLYGTFDGSTLTLRFTHWAAYAQLSVGATLTLTAEFT